MSRYGLLQARVQMGTPEGGMGGPEPLRRNNRCVLPDGNRMNWMQQRAGFDCRERVDRNMSRNERQTSLLGL